MLFLNLNLVLAQTSPTFFFRIGSSVPSGCPEVQNFDGSGVSACGQVYSSESKYWAAIAGGASHCGETVTLTVGGNSISLIVMDECPACHADNHVDMGLEALIELTGSAEAACAINRPPVVAQVSFGGSSGNQGGNNGGNQGNQDGSSQGGQENQGNQDGNNQENQGSQDGNNQESQGSQDGNNQENQGSQDGNNQESQGEQQSNEGSQGNGQGSQDGQQENQESEDGQQSQEENQESQGGKEDLQSGDDCQDDKSGNNQKRHGQKRSWRRI